MSEKNEKSRSAGFILKAPDIPTFIARRRDNTTIDIGPAYRKAVKHARVAIWASYADWEETGERIQAHLARRPRPEVLPHTWMTLPRTVRAKYLAGEGHPQSKTVDCVALTAPRSREAHQCVLWMMLLPETDVAMCRRLSLPLGGQQSADQLVAGLLCDDPAVAMNIPGNLNNIASLTVAIRSATAEASHSRAYACGRAMIKALGYFCLHPFGDYMAQVLWPVVASGLLNGLSDGAYTIAPSDDFFQAFRRAITNRVEEAERLAGGKFDALQGGSLPAAVYVGLFRSYISELGTPGVDAHTRLIDALERSHTLNRTNQTDVSVMEKYQLFVPNR